MASPSPDGTPIPSAGFSRGTPGRVPLTLTVLLLLVLSGMAAGFGAPVGHGAIGHPMAVFPLLGSGPPDLSAAPVAPLPAAGPTAASSASWVNITSGVTGGPLPRFNTSVAYQAGDHRYLLFGGQSGTRFFGDTWLFANGQWQDLSPTFSPSPRAGASIAYDSSSGSIVLFGGADATGVLADTWTFTNSHWNRMPSVNAPQGRYEAAMGDEPDLQGVLLFGGQLGGVPKNDTWSWNASGWTLRSTGGSGVLVPPRRSAAMMAFEPSQGRVVLFGGLSAVSTQLNDTWQHTATGWLALPTSGAPSPRSDAAFAWDPSDGALVLYGGVARTGGALSDTWLFNLTWSPFGAPAGPPPRWGAGLALSVTPGGAGLGLMLFGGTSLSSLRNDTWFFGRLPLSVLPPAVSPGTVDVGVLTQFSLFVFGGTPPYHIAWGGISTPCPMAISGPVVSCRPTVPAPYSVFATVRENGSSALDITSASRPWLVNLPPTVTQLNATTPVTLGSPVSITVVVTGGTLPLTYTYSGLPPGCGSSSVRTLTCTPSTIGTYSVSVNVTDADGAWTISHIPAIIVVQLAQKVIVPTWEYVVVGVLLLFILVAVIILVRQKFRPFPPPRGAGYVPPGVRREPTPPASGPPGGVRPGAP